MRYLESVDDASKGSYPASRLQCSPFYYDWASEPEINVIGAEMVPSSSYDVQAYGSTCKGVESGCGDVSPVVTMTTRRFGDMVAAFNPGTLPPTTQPDANDVASSVNKFKQLPGVLSKTIAQNFGNLVDANADQSSLDIALVVDGAKGFRYPFSGPCPCPSAVPCDFTACAGAADCTGTYGAGATCVKTCAAGSPRAGEICNNGTPSANPDLSCGACSAGSAIPGLPCDADADCPGGTCGIGFCSPGGFCRDRCSRCAP
jgi:hypothetical protein